MSSRKKGAAPKPVKSALIYNDKEVPEGSALHALFLRLAGLGERELAGAAFVIDILAAAKKLGQMQAQLDRMEGRVMELVKACSGKAPEPETPARKTPAKTAKKPTKAAKASVAKELAEMEETVEQRQARMAKMEKEEKRKALALKKKQEELRARKEKEVPKEPEKSAEAEAAPKKKRPRRRRKTVKKDDSAAKAGAGTEG